MKICFVLENHFTELTGGAELQAWYLCNYLEERGNEISYIFFSSNDIIQRKDNGVYLYPLRRKFGKGIGYSIFSYYGLRRILKRIQPDIIYQRCISSLTGMSGHYSRKNDETKMILGVSSDRECRKHRINFDRFSLPSFINEHLGRYGISAAERIVSQTHHQKQLLRQNFNKSSIVIPNGHPVPSPPFVKEDPPLVVWIANLKMLKQPEIFIRLADELDVTGARFAIVGRSGPAEYQKKITMMMRKIENISYLGEVPFEQTNDILSKASVLVNTSKYEGFSNTFIQAWMRETPVVSLNVDADDILKSKRIGFHSGGFERLVRDVRYLIDNDEERRAMGNRARRYAIENHRIETFGKSHLEIFKEVAEI